MTQNAECVKDGQEFRDRLKSLEIKQDYLEKGVMRNAIIGGIIGALVGSGASPAVTKLVGLFLGH